MSGRLDHVDDVVVAVEIGDSQTEHGEARRVARMEEREAAIVAEFVAKPAIGVDDAARIQIVRVEASLDQVVVEARLEADGEVLDLARHDQLQRGDDWTLDNQRVVLRRLAANDRLDWKIAARDLDTGVVDTTTRVGHALTGRLNH